jgi:transcriptional regulator with XRE-family HTH domain
VVFICTNHDLFFSVLHNLVRDFPSFFGYDPCVIGLTLGFYLTIMVHFPESITSRGAKKQHPGESALALRNLTMDTTPVSVETREIVRCAYSNCRLIQYRTSNSLCRRCHKPLDVEEPVKLAPQLVTSQPGQSTEAGLQVAAQVRDIRRARHLSQRQLAGRMQVPRTYISKIENGKAIPTLGSLERLARALEVDICQLVRDSRSRREEEVAAIFNDTFLAEIAAALPTLDSLHRTLVMSAARDAAMGQRRTA